VRAAAGTPRYLDDAALDAQWFVDGWARTGDVGVRSADGTIRLVGRAREQILLGSGRLAPDTVEAILLRRLAPGTELVVAAVSARGRSDAIAAFLAGDPADPAVARARDTLLAVKGPFRPSQVHCVPAIPRNAMGKPLRRELVRLVWQNQEPSE
jgi:malonyl-CoA/methylmalonyl-CoA synthetase